VRPNLWSKDFQPFLSLFNDTWDKLHEINSKAASSGLLPWIPQFDVKETKEAYILEGELPGIDQKNLNIEFSDNNTLTIRGHTEHVCEEGEKSNEPSTEGLSNGKPEGNKGEAAQNSSQVATSEHNKDSIQADKASQTTYWYRERSAGDFQRSFYFPDTVDRENVKASLKKGVLNVMVPKLSPVEKVPKKIEVEQA